MTSEPLRTTDVAALALDYSDRLIVETVRDVHQAVANRVFGATRVVGSRFPELVHDAFAQSIYGAISGTLRVSSGSVRSLSAHGVGRPVEKTYGGRRIVATLNGLIGDELRSRDDPQTIKMALRHEGQDVPATPFPLGQAHRPATGHIVVMVHGLCENDESWERSDKNGSVSYGRRISAETDGTPVVVRYNSGLHVSENGRHLHALMMQVVDSWPVPVTRITLVGHSMGGLVVRAATNHATAEAASWPGLVRDIVCLGTPHAGAALEKAAYIVSRALGFFRESSPFGAIADSRSDRIRDLRHGYISQDEWEGQDLTSQWGLDRIAAAPLPHAEYHFVAATLGASQMRPVSAMLGDLMVHFSSAYGSGRNGAVVDGAHLEYLAGTDHFALLNHPVVGDWIVEWINAKSRNPQAIGAREKFVDN